MAQIVIKSKEELARMPALADGTYPFTIEYVTKTTPPEKESKVVNIVVKDGKYSDGLDLKDVDFETFKKYIGVNLFDKVASAQVTIDVATAKDPSAGAAKETPWLLYAAGAAVLYLILKGKKS